MSADGVVGAYRRALEHGDISALVALLHPDVVLNTSQGGKIRGVGAVSTYFDDEARDAQTVTSVGDSYVDEDVVVVTISRVNLTDGDENEYAVAFFLGPDDLVRVVTVDV